MQVAKATFSVEHGNMLRQQRDAFDLRMTPTLLEKKVGSPGYVEGRTLFAQQAKSFAEGMKGVLRTTADTHWRVQGDMTLTDAARLVRSANVWKKELEQRQQGFNRLRSDAEELFGRLRKRREAAVEPPSHAGKAAIDAELRAHYRTLPIAKQIEAQKNPVMRAALARAPAEVTGLPEETHAQLQHDHWSAVEPNEAADYGDALIAFDAAVAAMEFLDETAKELVDFKTAAKFEAAASHA